MQLLCALVSDVYRVDMCFVNMSNKLRLQEQ